MDQERQQQENEERRRAEEECKEWCARCTPSWWPKDALYCYCKAPAYRFSLTQNLAPYEHNGWLYGVADRPSYSDTPKDRK